VAELESEKVSLEADLVTLESLAKSMKDALVALRQARNLRLDEPEQEKFDEL